VRIVCTPLAGIDGPVGVILSMEPDGGAIAAP
jgi:hypothetical protein